MLDLVKLTLILLTVLWCFIGELELVRVTSNFRYTTRYTARAYLILM